MNKYFSWNIALLLILSAGLIILVAGIYFKINNMTSSGLQMDEFGNSGTAGTINGSGMIFCGVLIAGTAVVMASSEKKKDV